MKNKDRLQRLKQLKIERHEGPVFNSSDECMLWIDNVAPLLKYDEHHYKTFLEHAQYVRITTLSSATIMPHLNSMIGIVNQAIIELENKIKPKFGIGTVRNVWHDSFWRKVLVSVVAGIILIFIAFLINKYILSSNNVPTRIQQEVQPEEQILKPSNQSDPKNIEPNK
jgi:hypothetical protein